MRNGRQYDFILRLVLSETHKLDFQEEIIWCQYPILKVR